MKNDIIDSVSLFSTVDRDASSSGHSKSATTPETIKYIHAMILQDCQLNRPKILRDINIFKKRETLTLNKLSEQLVSSLTYMLLKSEVFSKVQGGFYVPIHRHHTPR